MSKAVKLARKLAVAIAGFLLIIIGAALLVLPGPGLLVIALGLFVLSLEFTWAERYYIKLERHAKKFLARLRSRF
jgi:uncharacterized protein (TIGR02611 family)